MFPRQSPNIYDLLIEKSYLCLTSNVNIKRAAQSSVKLQLYFSRETDWEEELLPQSRCYILFLFHVKCCAYAKFCCSRVLPSFLLRPSLGVFCFIMRQQVRLLLPFLFSLRTFYVGVCHFVSHWFRAVNVGPEPQYHHHPLLHWDSWSIV